METSVTEKQPGGNRPSRTLPIVAGGVLLGLLAGLLLLSALGLGPFGPYQFHGTVVPSPEPVTDFTLTAHTGERVSLNDFRGKVVLLYFGYTYCPDICPTTLANLARVMDKLGRRSDEVQVVMISVDPERDTPEKLAKYVTTFDPSFIGLTGSPAEIATVTTMMGIFYEKESGTIESGYLVNHTASILVIDQEGALRLVYSLDTPDEDIASDLRQLTR